MPFGRAIRESGRLPVLLTGRVPETRLQAWETVYEEIRVLDDPYDEKTLLERALQVSSKGRLRALFSCYDGLVLPAACVAAKLGLSHPTIPGVVQSRNKYATRLATARQGVPTPRFFLVASLEECPLAAAKVGFPAIVKPLNGMASHLVQRVDDTPTLRNAYQTLVERIHQSFPGNYSRPLRTISRGSAPRSYDPLTTFLVEQYLEGEEYSAEVIVRGGQVRRVALFHKFLVDPDGFLERGFTCPPLELDLERQERIWRHIEACLRAIGLDHSAAHVEVIDTVDGPFLVEVNAGRAGGQILVRAVREGLGIDLIREILALQCGESGPSGGIPCLTGRVTTLTIFPPASGRIDQLEGLDEVVRLPGVVDVIPFCGPRDVIDIRDKEFFAINLLVQGGEAETLCQLYQQACRLVRFKITPEDSQPSAESLSCR